MIRSLRTVLFLLAAAPALAAQGPPASGTTPAAGLTANRVILRVTDLDESVAFYRDRVGLPLRFSNDELALFDLGNTMLLMLREGAGGPRRSRRRPLLVDRNRTGDLGRLRNLPGDESARHRVHS